MFGLRRPPAGLSRRAHSFVSVHGVWLDVPPVSQFRGAWQEAQIPADVIDRAEAYQARWGGLVLPSAPGMPEDAAGPRMLSVDTPEQDDTVPPPGWFFEAGLQRTAVPYAFLIGPDGTFGIAGGDDGRWVPLHHSIDGWVEASALAYAAMDVADTVTRLTGSAVGQLDLAEMRPVAEVGGITNGWWYRPGLLAAVYSGESELFSRPDYRTAYLYAGNINEQWL
ncbi:hypothetical protein OIE14_09850 [Micromonospora peucetia]|uniref:SUKH-3 immunity protein n=1 Tax=Micromonospora peucetia TaxID=47871 RepID=A0ABZ1EJ95_9ACTN|nr:hypothetical protein OIE14_09850 [Micromonospora peucetia]